MQRAPSHPVPVFPLPGTVLFPHTALPLHIFELRYRTMVREALSRGRLIALALLKPGWELDYYGSPEFHPLACLARIEDIQWLDNDCYDLRVKGLARVKVTRIVSEYPYRAARVELVPEHPYPDDDPLVELEKRALADTFERLLVAMGASYAQARIDRSVSYETLVNLMCAGSELSATQRLELLAVDSVLERGRRIRELTERRLRQGVVSKSEPPEEPEEGGERN